MLKLFRSLAVPGSFVLTFCIAGCGSSGTNVVVTPITVSVPSAAVVVPQDGATATAQVTIGGTTSTPTVTVSGLPSGAQGNYAASTGMLTFTATNTTPAGTYSPSVSVSAGGQVASANFTLVVAPVAKVGSTVDTSLGVGGMLKQFMATSFQIGPWTTDYFGSGTTETSLESTLTNLGTQHIRVQVISTAVPMISNTGTAADWNFSLIDTTLQPILNTADHSPELQIGTAPAWMCNSSGYLDVKNHVNDFAALMANMVRYYNKGGFDVGGTHFQSASQYPITWWGIFNEFNGNGLSATDYVTLYNTVVPAMLAVDPTIKLSAFEFSDYGLDTGDGGDPMVFFPTFVAAANAGGVSAPVTIISTHFYGTCNQTTTDAQVFSSVPQFAQNVSYFYKELQTRPDLANVPVWVTENNVNADFSAANGMSTCNPNQVFVDDHRGTSAYFAAWRPYVFSQLGKVGNQALYHWSYTADQQYGEVDGSGNIFLSYWVDRTLETLYPSTAATPGEQILTLNATESTDIETLATKNANGSVTVMVVDMAVASPTDNNGAGVPRTVVVDTTSLGTFSSASLITIDAATNIANGPTGVGVTPASRMNVALPGYGVAFLTLTP